MNKILLGENGKALVSADGKVLTAPANSGGSGGGSKLYRHYCRSDYASDIYFDLITKDATPFTTSTLAEYLYTNDISIPVNNVFPLDSTTNKTGSKITLVPYIYSINGTSIKCYLYHYQFTITDNNIVITKSGETYWKTLSLLEDTVIEL